MDRGNTREDDLELDRQESVKAARLRLKSPRRETDTASAEQERAERRAKRRRLSNGDEDRMDESPTGKRYRRRHHNRHRRRKEHKEASTQGGYDPNKPLYADPDTAFRESLFDAMADDEGADFWENVYGQPIHTYSNMKQPEPGGELEQMNDDEYVSYVQARMWEKTHQHILEERAKREADAKRRREWRDRSARMEAEADGFDRKIEESLRKGQERSNRKRWKDAWMSYATGWEGVKQAGVQHDDKGLAIPWPVKSGRMEDISKEEVEKFMRNGIECSGTRDLTSLLKGERIRWHPDKMQQRAGSLNESSRRAVTAVFQFLDSMLSELKTG